MNIRSTAAIAALFAALGTAPVEATEVSVAFTRRSAVPGATTPASEGEVVLRLVPAASAETAPVERRVSLTSASAFDLSPGHWQVEAVSEQWWHAPQYIFVTDKPAQVNVDLWRAGSVTGTIALKSSPVVPGDVRMRFQAAAERPELPSYEVFCTVAEATYRCKVPLGQLDLRLRSPGYLPRYYWDTNVSATAPVKLGAAVLEKGASLTGTVLLGRGVELTASESENIQVLASPANAQLPLHAAGLGRYMSRAGKRGHFHIDGLPPGDYIVRAAAGKLLFSDDVHVVVIADAVAELREPLRVEAPSTLRVSVKPSVDPWGKPWKVTLKRDTPEGGHPVDGAEETAGEAGEWLSPPLRSGQYTVNIGSDEGVWASRALTLPGDAKEIAIGLAPVKLTGTVTLGDRPLQSTVQFQSDDVPSIEVATDREGKFQSYLPQREAMPWTVVVVSKDPVVRHTFRKIEPKRDPESEEATLDLRVPFTTLSGFVVDEDGKAASAIVNVTAVDEPLMQVMTADDGHFVVHGLRPATYSVQAMVFLGESDVLHTEVTDELTPDPLHIVVRSQQKIEGRVASDAAPVAGAEVWVIAKDVLQQLIMPAATDFRGQFGATAPRTARELDIVVGAPGFDVRMFHQRAPVGPLQIRVTQHGGRLVLPTATGDLQPYLQHAGATQYLGESVRGMQVQVRATDETSRQLVLSPMEPGPYSLCMLRHSEQPLLRAGLIDRRERCSEGFLPPHGELIFATPRILKR